MPASFWNNREQHYREALARKRATESLATQVGWLDKIPYKAMVDKGWIPKTDNKIQLVQHLLMFFGVASPRSWNDIWEGAQISFRQSATLRSDPGAVAVWLRKGELEALNVPADEFDSNRFKHALKSIRGMTRELPRDFASVVMAECGKAGVRVVFVPELPNTCTWGATRWLSQSNALIQLSLRYKTDPNPSVR